MFVSLRREIAPTHFPSVNGSFDTYDIIEDKPKYPCCTGVPPKVFDRNAVSCPLITPVFFVLRLSLVLMCAAHVEAVLVWRDKADGRDQDITE